MKDQAWLMYGDCETKLREVDDESVNLIFTSPPYAMARKKYYGGIPESEYSNWFLSKSKEFMRVLTQDGSFVLNIKEGGTGKNGALSSYVVRLIAALVDQDWYWVDEYIWVKNNAYPGYKPNQFRNAWERLLHFSKQKHIKIRKDEVRVPMSQGTKRMIKYAAMKGVKHGDSRFEPVRWNNGEKRLKDGLVYPTNVLTGASWSGRPRGHPAVFPEWLPHWFIRLLTDKDDVVLDPFAGSGTTGLVALDLGRKTIGIESKMEYFDLIKSNWNRMLNEGEPLDNILNKRRSEPEAKEKTLFNTLMD